MSFINNILSKILITCKAATLLAVKEQELAISLREKINLHLHLFFCTICALFYKQSNYLHTCVKHLANKDNGEEIIQLNEQKTITLQNLIEKELKK